ncbi:MAG: hypothetical protein RDU25_04920 [Patescibacteria group bacterium]|nr:hypothetical protein [Patescibacteria group bacterium]
MKKEIVEIPNCGTYAMSQEALEEYLGRARRRGCKVRQEKHDGHSYRHPDWVIEPPATSRGENLYEAWHWAPLQPSPRLHEVILHAAGQTPDCGFYYQDGRQAFFDFHLFRMRLFVEHLTSLDLKRWNEMVKRAPKGGPEMIRAIAAFCHPQAVVTDRPNEGNILVAFGKALSGQKPTKRDLEAAADAWKDEAAGGAFRRAFGRR